MTTENREVALYNEPEAVLAQATKAAVALKRVVAGKLKPVIFNNEQYLEFEDWQTVGQFYGYTVKTHDALPIEVFGVKGAKALADLVDFHTGEIIGSAEAYCMRDEPKWSTRTKYEWQDTEDGKRERVAIGEEPVPWFQLASMAQTRAGAKALRNRLAWVVVLAGYKPTPAEEMTGTEHQEEQTQKGHWCSSHNCVFFKKGKMKGYSHPIQGTDPQEWCNESEEKKPEAKPPDVGTNQSPTGQPPAIDWGKVQQLAAQMGIKGGTGIAKALHMPIKGQALDLSAWKETEEVALDQLYEYAKLQGYTGPAWREIQL